jgi:hypothetical protein
MDATATTRLARASQLTAGQTVLLNDRFGPETLTADYERDGRCNRGRLLTNKRDVRGLMLNADVLVAVLS